ncbi:MAG: DNA alkylation repair protein [Bacteroidota bacterium]
MKTEDIISLFQRMENPENVKGMLRYGIGGTGKMYGISIPLLRKLAKDIGTDHELAVKLWATDIHEAHTLATLTADTKMLTPALMEEWVVQLYSWDICDQVVMNYFEKSSFAWEKAVEWSRREELFVKRAGFVMMARLAQSDRKAEDSRFRIFYEHIIRESTDGRNLVKKAVNWAIRQIGKRNISLNREMLDVCETLLLSGNKTARWIALDAKRELSGDNVQQRLKKKENKSG